MDRKTILRKVFNRYAAFGAKAASIRGCYEPTVPKALRVNAMPTERNTESTQQNK